MNTFQYCLQDYSYYLANNTKKLVLVQMLHCCEVFHIGVWCWGVLVLAQMLHCCEVFHIGVWCWGVLVLAQMLHCCEVFHIGVWCWGVLVLAQMLHCCEVFHIGVWCWGVVLLWCVWCMLYVYWVILHVHNYTVLCKLVVHF